MGPVGQVINWIAGVPAWVLDHPLLFGLGVIVSAAGYLFALDLFLAHQERADRRRNAWRR